ncbi:hypothetical protein RR46_02830 [Papilio xuthus]|uniref:Uncharacterized protein n=1 Tax=Papilio xuthus TaxID=66420 RepID=A0A194QBI2_PAPXU|nr:hypothetical protein RR46_02830 [Papilio xuthus]
MTTRCNAMLTSGEMTAEAARFLSPRKFNAGSSGVANTAVSCATACTTHSTAHMYHNHITTLHYLIVGTTFTKLNQCEHLTMLITPVVGTIILWKQTLQ